MEREVIVTGIGGQGIQLLAKTLALAATREGHHAMLSADYGGEMRGGPSKASVVVGDEPLRALPVLPSAWSAILAHHRYLGPPTHGSARPTESIVDRIRSGGPVVINSKLVDAATLRADLVVHPIDAGAIAIEVASAQAVGFVLLGYYNAVTGMVSPEALAAAMGELLPPYRKQHAAANERALAAGADALSAVAEVA